MNNESLKQQVNAYWNRASCGTDATKQQKFSHIYFEEIERARYRTEPEIFSFAQFTRFYGKKMLEVGVGAGTDFMQWVRAGTYAHGIDLTQEALDNVQHRLELYGLQAAQVRVADAESIPYNDNEFDLVYSWGVIHHSPNTLKCLEEIIRVTKPGGTIKLMVYNRYSIDTLYLWIDWALLKWRPFQSFSKVLYYHQESIGTKAYTCREIKKILAAYPVIISQLTAPPTQHQASYHKSRRKWYWLAYFASCIWGWQQSGWFMLIELKKM